MLALTLDIAIVILLLVALGAGIRLHGALKIFRVDSSEFQPMIQALDKATSRAEMALGRLRKMAEDVGGKLNHDAKATQRLLDELDFMTKRADQLAARLDDSIGKARSVDSRTGRPSPAGGDPLADDPDTRAQPSRRRVPDLEQRLKNLR
ncbi:MAG: hypothetical protein HC871_04870 [Rhizobiales bacterium]|nr:hypothetical protein [Hyphomicrobiales bacterium]